MSRFSCYGVLDRDNPQAAALCDRGGEVRKHVELKKQMEWSGNKLVWSGLLVCEKHMDIPNPQDRYIKLKADPRPIINPRPDVDAAAVKRALVFADGSAITYPTGEWVEANIGVDVDRRLDEGGRDVTPPIIAPNPIIDNGDLRAPLDVFLLDYNVLSQNAPYVSPGQPSPPTYPTTPPVDPTNPTPPNTTPPVIDPIDPTNPANDLLAPLDVFVLDINVLYQSTGGTTTPTGPTTPVTPGSNALLGQDAARLLGQDTATLTPPA